MSEDGLQNFWKKRSELLSVRII